MFSHIGNWWHDIIYVATYVVADQARFRRFINLALFVGVVVIGWWLLFHGGWQVIRHDFGTTSITRSRRGPR